MEGHENKAFIIILLLFYVLAVTYIGYRNRKSRNSEDYFLASRSMPAWLLAITFIASWWGGGSAIDLVDVAHNSGISSFWVYGVPVLIATGLMYLFAAAIRRVGTVSQSELIEKRYDSRTAFMLTIFIFVFMTIGAAIQVIVVGNFFHSFFALDYTLSAIIGTSLVIIYSLFGGFRGVVLTDLFQFVFFLFASIAIFMIVYNRGGGFDELASHAESLGREGFTSFFHNLGDNMAYIITFGTSWMIQANVWQRISAARTPQSARKMMIISFVVFIPLYLMVTLSGMLSILVYDTVPSGGIVSALVLSLESPIVSAIIFVGLCSAIMSTMDSMFNTGALTLTIDVYKRYIKPNRKAQHYVAVGRLATLVIAAASLLIALEIKSVLTISWIGADFLATGAFVPLVLGFIWRRGTSKAALCSMIFGLLFSSYNLLVALGVNLPTGWEIASAQQAMVGVAGSLILFVTVSLLTKPDYHKFEEFSRITGFLKK